ncbi:MAG: hypothetical protein E6I46_04625 [Chloroflexi bacterium]|nr:MAG: hypothetical protein E6I46_04625 [Chloroflexota bacterium]
MAGPISFTASSPRNWRDSCGNSWPLDEDRAGRRLLLSGSEQDHCGGDRHDPDGGHGDDERSKRIAGRMRLPVEREKDQDRSIKQERETNRQSQPEANHESSRASTEIAPGPVRPITRAVVPSNSGNSKPP